MSVNPSEQAIQSLLRGQKAHKGDLTGKCGEILSASKSLVIGCKNGSVSLDVLQKSGGKALEIKQFLCGYHFNVGEFLG